MATRPGLLTTLIVATGLFVLGINWGLPSRRSDRLIFGGEQAWSGGELAELVGLEGLADGSVGADVDVNPVGASDEPVVLTTSRARRAELIARYRLYSYQPDEMITFRALYKARADLDPRLYQYGGLFIYSVGAVLELGWLVGLIELRPDLAFYLDYPEAFGRFYVAGRLVVVICGLMGVAACYVLGWRLGGQAAGVLAGLLFALMPVTINMVHEAKPHLPAAVWMLLAVLSGLWYLQRGGWRLCVLSAVLCGLAAASVLSGALAWLILATMLMVEPQRWRRRLARLAVSTAVMAGVYLLFNPFVLINLFANRAVLRSNLGNSTAMYRVGQMGQGLVNVAALSIEAMGLAVAVCGLAGAVWLLRRRRTEGLLLSVPAAAVLVVMTAIGAGKPGEFGRFGMFAYAVLAVLAGSGCAALAGWRRRVGIVVTMVVLVGTAASGLRYLRGFCIDAYGRSSRVASAEWLNNHLVGWPEASIGVVQEPAPYAISPIDFAHREVVLLPARRPSRRVALPEWLIVSADRREALRGRWWLDDYELVARFPTEPLGLLDRPTVISWANKPIFIFRRRQGRRGGEVVIVRHAVGGTEQQKVNL